MDALEGEAAGRHGPTCRLSIPSVEDLRDRAGLEPSLPHGNERSDERPNHMVQERVRHGSDRHQPGPLSTDGEPSKIPNGRAVSSGMSAEAREVVLTDQEASGLAHPTLAECSGPLPYESSRERVG